MKAVMWGDIEKAALLLSLAAHRPSESNELKAILKSLASNSWRSLARLIELNSTQCMSEHWISEYGIRAQHWSSIWSFSEKVRKENRERVDAARAILNEMIAQGVSVIILKGNYLCKEVYGLQHYKKMNDVDILVQRKDLRKVQEIYQEKGLLSVGSLSNDSAQTQEAFSHHWPPYFTSDLRCVFGTHWNLVSPLIGIELDEESLWENSIPYDYYGVPVRTLGQVDFVHHLLIHLPYYKTGLREVSDIYNFIRKFEINWTALHQLVHRCKSQDRVYRNLVYSNLFCPNENAASLCKALENEVKPHVQRDVRRLLRLPEAAIRSRTVHPSRVEKAYTLFQFTEDPFEKTKYWYLIWKNFLSPPREDLKKMTLDKLGWLPFRGALRMNRYFAEELGWRVHLFLMVRHQVDLMKCWISFFYKKSRIGVNSKFQKLGLSPVGMKKVIDAMQ